MLSRMCLVLILKVNSSFIRLCVLISILFFLIYDLKTILLKNKMLKIMIKLKRVLFVENYLFMYL